MIKNSLIVILLILWHCGFAQQEKMLTGRVIVKDGSAKEVHVVNVANESESVSDDSGNFKISAKADDVLVFSSAKLDFQRLIVDQQIYDSGVLEITMTSKATNLDEVEVVNYNKFNAVDLRILSNKPKSYTPAERRLRTAGDFKPIQLLGIIAGGMEFDPIINAINGKTKRLKALVKQEKKELLLLKISETYSDEFFVNEMKIPADYVKGFKYYLAEDPEFTAIFVQKNREATKFVTAKLAVLFNQSLSDEKK
ncbi:hypothetical protein [Flavobacterium sp.]|uniref:hypothetical protein n=1 Tax=Flavobacterium sp. TaxID=239 RepID=UPI00262C0B1B|nr:hypothetical protein [Flavobacterium sp.]